MNKDLGFASEQLTQLSTLRKTQTLELLQKWIDLFETLGNSMKSCSAIREINVRFNEDKYHEICAFNVDFLDATGRRIFEPDLHGMHFEDYAVILDINKVLQFNLSDFIRDFQDLRHDDRIKISAKGCDLTLQKYTMYNGILLEVR